MKFLKILILVILVLVVLVGVGSLFLPSQVHVERSKVIDAPKNTLFNVVLDLHTWTAWDPWSQIDENMVTTYEGNRNGVGMVRKWTSENKNVGTGSMTITDVEDGKEIEHHLDFGEHGTAESKFEFEEVEGGTKVTWGFDSDMGMNPIAKYMGLMMDDIIGKDFAKGLDGLEAFVKNLPEPEPALGGMEFSLQDMPAMNLLSIKTTDVSLEEISKITDEHFGKLYAFAGENNIETTGSPSAIWYDYKKEENKASFAICISVVDGTKGNDGFELVSLEPFTAVVYNYKGSYEDMEVAYDLIMEYIDNKTYTITGPPMEIYIVGPVQEDDPSKWETHIVFPIEKPVTDKAPDAASES